MRPSPTASSPAVMTSAVAPRSRTPSRHSPSTRCGSTAPPTDSSSSRWSSRTLSVSAVGELAGVGHAQLVDDGLPYGVDDLLAVVAVADAGRELGIAGIAEGSQPRVAARSQLRAECHLPVDRRKRAVGDPGEEAVATVEIEPGDPLPRRVEQFVGGRPVVRPRIRVLRLPAEARRVGRAGVGRGEQVEEVELDLTDPTTDDRELDRPYRSSEVR